MRYVKCILDLEKDIILKILKRSDDITSLKTMNNKAYSVDNFGVSISNFEYEREMILDLDFKKEFPDYMVNHKQRIIENYDFHKNLYEQYIRSQKIENLINKQD